METFFQPQHKRFFFHNSGISLYQSCPRKFYKDYIEATPSYEINASSDTDLFVGAVLAKVLEESRRLYLTRCGDTTTTSDYILNIAISRARELYGDHVPSVKAKSLDGLILAIQTYFKRFPLDSPDNTFMLEHGSPSIEVEFCVPFFRFYDYQVFYTGRLDGILKDSVNDYWILDDKLTTVTDATWSLRWAYDSQMLGYLWALSKKGVKVKGIVIRKITVSTNATPKVQPLYTIIPPSVVESWYHAQMNLCTQICRSTLNYMESKANNTQETQKEIITSVPIPFPTETITSVPIPFPPLIRNFPQYRSYQCHGTSRKLPCKYFSNCYQEASA